MKPIHYRMVGLILVILSIASLFLLAPLLIWKIDEWRGWEVKLSTTIPGYVIIFVHRPGYDFYDTYFELTRSDGKTTTIIIDSDDSKWWSQHMIKREGRIYFTRSEQFIPDQASYIDSANGLIYSGHYQQLYKLSELEFK